MLFEAYATLMVPEEYDFLLRLLSIIGSNHSPSKSDQVYSLHNMDIHCLSTLRSIVAAPAYNNKSERL